jgi:hypothetical protein
VRAPCCFRDRDIAFFQTCPLTKRCPFFFISCSYSYHVPRIEVATSSTASAVDISVTLTQIGVAPFYYPLSLGLSCSGMTKKTLTGVDSLKDTDASVTFTFLAVPTTTQCLGALALSFESAYLYPDRPMLFSQGNGKIILNVPLPSGSTPVPPPVQAPVKSPVSTPTSPFLRWNLWNANTDTIYTPNFKSGGSFCRSIFDFAFEAVTDSTVSKVFFSMTGPNGFSYTETETSALWALFGNVGNDFYGQKLPVGTYSLSATANGDSSKSSTISFTVNNC